MPFFRGLSMYVSQQLKSDILEWLNEERHCFEEYDSQEVFLDYLIQRYKDQIETFKPVRSSHLQTRYHLASQKLLSLLSKGRFLTDRQLRAYFYLYGLHERV